MHDLFLLLSGLLVGAVIGFGARKLGVPRGYGWAVALVIVIPAFILRAVL